MLRFASGLAVLALLDSCSLLSSPPHREASSRYDVAYLFGPEAAGLARLPSFRWRPDGTLLWRDEGAAHPKLLHVVDPGPGSSRPLAQDEVLSQLRQELGDAAPTSLGWPEQTDASGTRALYTLADDLFVVGLEDQSVRRVTRTPDEKEENARFSPDGQRIAFTRGNDLWCHDLTRGETRPLTEDGAEGLLNGTLSWVYWEEIFGRQDIGYWWSGDSACLAFLRTDESAVTGVEFVDFQPAVPRIIHQKYPKAGTANPVVRVALVEVASGQVTHADMPAEDFEYLARVQWLPDHQRVAVQTLSRDQRTLHLYLVDRSTGAAHRILTETDPGWVNIHDDLYFLADGEHFLWASERTGYNHLYRYRLDGTLVNAVTTGDYSLRSSGGGVFWLRQAVCAIDEAGDWVYFTSLKDGSTERHLYRVHADGSGLERLTMAPGFHEITFSPDARTYLDVHSTAGRPPRLLLCHGDGRDPELLADSAAEAVQELGLETPEPLVIPARDGFPMPAQITRPADHDPGRRYPVILHVYAGPSAPMVQDQWNTTNRLFDQLLVDAGYLVVRVDNRSATAISKTLENEIVLEMSGDSELNDITDAVRWLRSRPDVDPDRIGVWGWSGGGTVTLLLLTRSQDFRAGIAVAPVTDWHYYDTKWAEMAMKTPADNPEGYRKTNLVARAADLHGDLLLVHGTYDDNVHPQNSWHLIDALVAADREFDVMFYPMRKHGIADAPARIHLYRRMLRFWKEHL